MNWCNLYPKIKQSILIGICLTAISCRENIKTPISKKVDTAKTVRAISSDSVIMQDTSIYKVEHKAYNQEIKNLPFTLKDFVPENYTALDTTYGDLNLDQYPDVIMVLKKDGEETLSDVVEHPEKRPLLILIGQANKAFKLAAENENAVYCIDCGGMMGDPFMDVVIKKGFFSIEHYGGSGWRWTRVITFKYSLADNYWYLHKDGYESFHVNNPEKIESKIHTTGSFGKVPFDKFDIYKEN